MPPFPIIGASLSEPHINGTALAQLYVHVYIILSYVGHLRYMYVVCNTDDHYHTFTTTPSSHAHPCTSDQQRRRKRVVAT